MIAGGAGTGFFTAGRAVGALVRGVLVVGALVRGVLVLGALFFEAPVSGALVLGKVRRELPLPV